GRVEVVQPGPVDSRRRVVRVVADEHTACAGARPQRARVLRRTCESGDEPAGTRAPRGAVELRRRDTVADADEVTAVRRAGGRRELGAVGFQVRLVAAPVLRPPDALRG